MATTLGYRIREIYIGINERIVTDRYFSSRYEASIAWHSCVGKYVCSLSPATITKPHVHLVRIEALDEEDDRVVISVSVKSVKMTISKDAE